MQQSAILQLMLSSTVLFLLFLVAAYLLVARAASRSQRAVEPVLSEFLRAGAASDSLRGHSLLSVRGLVTYDESDVAALYARRDLFVGFRKLRIRSFRSADAAAGQAAQSAEVVAEVLYTESEPATLTARMELEEGEWHIGEIRIQRAKESWP